MRRYRSWACPCCGREWTRRRGEDHPFWPASCSTCERKLVAARASKDRHRCVHDRDAARVRVAAERMEGRPRTRGGRVLSPPASVRETWREVRRAKTKPAVARRGAKFIRELLAYSRDERSRLRIHSIDRHGRATSKPVYGGGMISLPSVKLDPSMGGHVWGEFRRAILQGRYDIRLNPIAPSCDHLRATLIHEVQHLLDDDLRISDGGHGRLWEARLAKLKAMFPPREL